MRWLAVLVLVGCGGSGRGGDGCPHMVSGSFLETSSPASDAPDECGYGSPTSVVQLLRLSDDEIAYVPEAASGGGFGQDCPLLRQTGCFYSQVCRTTNADGSSRATITFNLEVTEAGYEGQLGFAVAAGVLEQAPDGCTSAIDIEATRR